MMTDETIEVKIFMKDGQRKFGLLLNGLGNLESNEKVFKFICNSQLQNYTITSNTSLIEMLPLSEINVVETYLR